MRDIRKGNDIAVQWSLMRDGQPFSLQGLNITLYLKGVYEKIEIKDFSISENKVLWRFHGKDQKYAGKYSLVLVVNDGEVGMITTDACDFVRLVSCTCQSDGADECGVVTETIDLESTIEYVAGGSTIIVDNEMSLDSANPVENRVITAALNDKQETISDLDDIRSKANSALQEIPSEYVTEEELDEKGYVTEDKLVNAFYLDLTDLEIVSVSDLENYITLESLLRTVGMTLAKFYNLAKEREIVLEIGESSLYPTARLVDAFISLQYNHPTGSAPFHQTLTLGILPKSKEVTIDGNVVIYGATYSVDELKFKTINDQNIIGEGNIEIQGGEDYDDTEIREALAEVETALGNKQDKEAGKGLSTNDFTNADKTLLEGVAKWGVVSQTQTWTQASDGGYDYVMSDLVRGWIPQANIDLFVSAGAVFNEGSGYFELNGLTDISYEEMQNIHNYTIPFSLGVSDAVALGWMLPIRTAYALKAKRFNIFTESWAYFFWQSANLEKLVFKDVVIVNNLQFAFTNCNKLAKIDGVFSIAGVSSAGSINNAFFQCHSLEDVRLMLLKVSVSFESSPRLSTDSILYMIENETATSAITITLHATAYARAMADTRITSALETHTNITLAEA